MQIIQDRRALHQIPELELTLPKTCEYITRSLHGLRCHVFAPMESAICAYFDFGADHSIAFRADMDALPIRERTGAEYASTHSGIMHACGHDGHMAILLELARRLNEEQSLKHNILLVFQPGEESPGGAKPLCETGIFTNYNVRAIFGLHLWPGLPAGEIFSRKEELMSRSCEVNVDITGRSAHIAKAREGLDAMVCGMKFLRRAYELEAAVPQGIFRLLKFGRMESGRVRNAISDHTRLEGSLRAFQPEIFEGLLSGLHRIGEELEQETGCTVTITTSTGYPAVMNPAALYDRVRAAAVFSELSEPSMTSEDFAWYQQHLPGIFFFLGLGDTSALHADDFDFDDRILEKGAHFFLELARRLP